MLHAVNATKDDVFWQFDFLTRRNNHKRQIQSLKFENWASRKERAVKTSHAYRERQIALRIESLICQNILKNKVGFQASSFWENKMAF